MEDDGNTVMKVTKHCPYLENENWYKHCGKQVPPKNKNTSTVRPSHPPTGNTSQGNEITSLLHNHQDKESTRVHHLMTRYKYVAYLHCGILLNHKQERDPKIYNKIATTAGHNAILVTKILKVQNSFCFYTYMQLLEHILDLNKL